MRKIYFWQLWDWEDFRGFLYVDLIFVIFLFLFFLPKIVHGVQGSGMKEIAVAQITNITTKEHIGEGKTGNYRSIDFYDIEYNYSVDGNWHKGFDVIPNSPIFQKFLFRLLHSSDTIFVKYDASHPEKSQLKTEK